MAAVRPEVLYYVLQAADTTTIARGMCQTALAAIRPVGSISVLGRFGRVLSETDCFVGERGRVANRKEPFRYNRLSTRVGKTTQTRMRYAVKIIQFRG